MKKIMKIVIGLVLVISLFAIIYKIYDVVKCQRLLNEYSIMLEESIPNAFNEKYCIECGLDNLTYSVDSVKRSTSNTYIVSVTVNCTTEKSYSQGIAKSDNLVANEIADNVPGGEDNMVYASTGEALTYIDKSNPGFTKESLTINVNGRTAIEPRQITFGLTIFGGFGVALLLFGIFIITINYSGRIIRLMLPGIVEAIGSMLLIAGGSRSKELPNGNYMLILLGLFIIIACVIWYVIEKNNLIKEALQPPKSFDEQLAEMTPAQKQRKLRLYDQMYKHGDITFAQYCAIEAKIKNDYRFVNTVGVDVLMAASDRIAVENKLNKLNESADKRIINNAIVGNAIGGLGGTVIGAATALNEINQERSELQSQLKDADAVYQQTLKDKVKRGIK